MKVGDIVKIKTYGGRYWKGKITKISDAYTHVYKYSEPVAYVYEIGGSNFRVVNVSNLREEEDGVWVEN